MDKNIQLLQVAQDLIGQLVAFLSQPTPPGRAIIQGALDAAGAKVQVINAAVASQPPLVIPQIAPVVV